MNNIEQIADKLRIAWNNAMGISNFLEWEDTDERSRRGYIAVAKAAVECACEKKYRDLTHNDMIQEGDEVWAWNRGPWLPVSGVEHGQQYRNGYYKMRRLVTATAQEELPQYRYLGMGEVMQAGDECSCNNGPWIALTNFWGCALGNPAFKIRRRVDDTGAALAAATSQILDFSECVTKQSARVAQLEKKLSSAYQTLAAIDYAVLKLRGFKAIHGPGPLASIEQAGKLIQDLQSRLDDAHAQIKPLEQQLVEKPTLTMLGEQLKKDLKAAQSCNLNFSKKIDELNIVNKTLQDGLGKMSDHNEVLQKELGLQSQGWSQVICYVIDNNIGVVGQSFPEIVLQALQNQIDWKGHHDSLKAQADAAMASRDQRLEDAARYINGLEADLSFYSTVDEFFKTRLETAAHGE